MVQRLLLARTRLDGQDEDHVAALAVVSAMLMLPLTWSYEAESPDESDLLLV